MEFEEGRKYDITFGGTARITLPHKETTSMGFFQAYYFGEGEEELILYSTDNGLTFFRPHGTRRISARIEPYKNTRAKRESI